MKAGAQHSSWPVKLFFLLSLLALLVSLFCFYQGHVRELAVNGRIQNILLQQVLLQKMMSRSTQQEPSVELADQAGRFEAMLDVIRDYGDGAETARQIRSAWVSLRDLLPGLRVSASLGFSDALSSTDFATLVEHSQSLLDSLKLAAAPATQIESADHLLQLSRSVADRMTEEQRQPGKARGPWLVYEQLLNRFELMSANNAIKDPDARHLLARIREHFTELDQDLQRSLAAVGARDASGARQAINGAAEELETVMNNQLVIQQLTQQQQRSWFRSGLLSLLIAACLLVAMAVAYWRQHQRQQASINRQHEREQASMLRLLDEISSLADGNLDTQATVTEDATGAIADSINYAVTELRRLVGEMLGTSEQVSAAVDEVGATATSLAHAGTLQSREIHRSSNYLKVMAETMTQISGRTTEASRIASQSVEQALQGRAAVGQIADSAVQVQTRVNELEKSLNRLSGSSTRIFDILKSVDEVTDKTRLLALNAAIRGGHQRESGPDSAQLADDVQQLATRLTQFAREIASVVEIIQQDIRSGSEALSRTGEEALITGSLCEDAAASLSTIEEVSRRLSVVVEQLARKTGRQSEVVSQLSANMGVINDVTRKSAHGMQMTAASLDGLKALAGDLQASVAGFRLPAESVSSVVDDLTQSMTQKPVLKPRRRNTASTGSGAAAVAGSASARAADDTRGEAVPAAASEAVNDAVTDVGDDSDDDWAEIDEEGIEKTRRLEDHEQQGLL